MARGRKRRRRGKGEDGASLVAVDMLTAALGAVVFLMLTFSIMKGRQELNRQRDYFTIQVQIQGDVPEPRFIGFYLKGPRMQDWLGPRDLAASVSKRFDGKLTTQTLVVPKAIAGEWKLRLRSKLSTEPASERVTVLIGTSTGPTKKLDAELPADRLHPMPLILFDSNNKTEETFETRPGSELP